MPSHGNQRPAIIMPWQDLVDLVAAGRAELAGPHHAGLGVPGHAIDIAVAIAPDFRQRARRFDEWVVGRHRTIVANPQDLADVAVQCLRLRACARLVAGCRAIAVTHADVQHPVRTKDHAATIGAERAFPRLCHQYVLHRGQPAIVEPGAGHSQCRGQPGLHLLGVRDIQQIVAGEIGMQNDIVQAADADIVERRQALNGFRIKHAIAHHAQAPATLGDQHGASIGQEHQPIGMRQAFRQLDDAHRHAALALQHDGLVHRRAGQRIGWIVAQDLGRRERRRDARRVDRLCGRSNGQGRHQRRHQPGFRSKTHASSKTTNNHIRLSSNSGPPVRPDDQRRQPRPRYIACPCACR